MPRHTLYLLRHGESEINIHQPPIIGGRSRWCELTPAGVAQARHLGRWLASTPLPCDRVVASTAVRAQQTARHALEVVGLPLRQLETSPALEEQAQGEWENCLRDACYTPEIQDQLRELHWNFRAPRGESFADVYARAAQWVEEEILSAEVDSTTWIFCHGGVIRALLTGFLGLSPRAAWTIPVDNASVTVLHHDGAAGWTARLRNHVPAAG